MVRWISANRSPTAAEGMSSICWSSSNARPPLQIVRELGQRIGFHVWCHALRHWSFTAALDVAAKAGIGLDKVRAHSRHAAIGTLLICADEHDREGTQRTLADLVAGTLIEKAR